MPLQALLSLFIGIADTDKDSAVSLHIITGGDHSFVKSLLHGSRNPQNLTCGFHLRPKLGIDVGQLLKRENGYLYRIILR